MKYEYQRTEDGDYNTDDGEPSLADMTEAAIKMLQKNDKGFFLMVEGGKIDKAHHAGQEIIFNSYKMFNKISNSIKIL